jgi:prevent-host-death family protein
MSVWQLQDAKARLSELVKNLEKDGPQEITVHGRPAAVLLSARDYQRLTAPKESLLDVMRRSPLYGLEGIDLERDKSPTRDFEFPEE